MGWKLIKASGPSKGFPKVGSRVSSGFWSNVFVTGFPEIEDSRVITARILKAAYR